MALRSKGPDFNITRVGDRGVRLERNAKVTAPVYHTTKPGDGEILGRNANASSFPSVPYPDVFDLNIYLA